MNPDSGLQIKEVAPAWPKAGDACHSAKGD
jgi:hypothetical protein